MPDMSKAFQLAGEAFVKAGLVDDAALTLAKGYEVACLKGDLMPKRAMAELLKSIGKPVPEVDGAAEIEAAQALSGAFMCSKTGRPGTKLAKPPFRGPVGAWIFENISSETWNAWIGQGTKVINELRLDLSRDQDAETYDRYMREYLGIDDGLLARLRAGA
jgi:Fe-S cluster biosynthesis and repair protein YggX